LNQSNTDAVMRLYASDGVFMPQNSPSSVGADEIRRAYDAVFRAIKLTVQFNVAEVVELAPNWVFARTNSDGTVKDHATGAGGPGGQSGTFPVSENRWNLEDRALLFFHN
jgi:ketosteroid isomerase-like protein